MHQVIYTINWFDCIIVIEFKLVWRVNQIKLLHNYLWVMQILIYEMMQFLYTFSLIFSFTYSYWFCYFNEMLILVCLYRSRCCNTFSSNWTRIPLSQGVPRPINSFGVDALSFQWSKMSLEFNWSAQTVCFGADFSTYT